jgi:hypothetical protein
MQQIARLLSSTKGQIEALTPNVRLQVNSEEQASQQCYRPDHSFNSEGSSTASRLKTMLYFSTEDQTVAEEQAVISKLKTMYVVAAA